MTVREMSGRFASIWVVPQDFRLVPTMGQDVFVFHIRGYRYRPGHHVLRKDLGITIYYDSEKKRKTEYAADDMFRCDTFLLFRVWNLPRRPRRRDPVEDRVLYPRDPVRSHNTDSKPDRKDLRNKRNKYVNG